MGKEDVLVWLPDKLTIFTKYTKPVRNCPYW